MADKHKEVEEFWVQQSRDALATEVPQDGDDIVRVYTPADEIEVAQAFIREQYLRTHAVGCASRAQTTFGSVRG